MLTAEEHQELVKIIAGTYDFADGDSRSRRTLIQGAKLDRFLPGINLAGAPRVVAEDLVGRLENFGSLPDRPTFHALGALLSYVLGLGELPPDQEHFFARLIVRYLLVLDPPYVDNLRSQYGITEKVFKPPVSAQIAPPATSVSTDILTFETVMRDEQELERIINTEDNFLDIYLLAGGN